MIIYFYFILGAPSKNCPNNIWHKNRLKILDFEPNILLKNVDGYKLEINFFVFLH